METSMSQIVNLHTQSTHQILQINKDKQQEELNTL